MKGNLETNMIMEFEKQGINSNSNGPWDEFDETWKYDIIVCQKSSIYNALPLSKMRIIVEHLCLR